MTPRWDIDGSASTDDDEKVTGESTLIKGRQSAGKKFSTPHLGGHHLD